jgi:glycosyltransferase involved in cell wall biosynthesis
MKHDIEGSLDRLTRWVEDHHYRAYDPGDGQLSYLRALTFNHLALERILTATVLRTPFNIRPMLGIAPHTSTKGMGYMAWGYLRRYRSTKETSHAEKAIKCLDWLIEHRSPRYPDFCWGNDFTFTTRAGRIPRGEPTIVWSGLIGQAFVDAHEILGQHRYLEIADSVCDWILKLPCEETDSGTCLSYVASHQLSIHNSNMLGGALLARVGKATGRSGALELARESMRYSCSRQNPDGAWFYGETPKYHWIDNFHTGYNLDSLKRYADSTGDSAFGDHLRRGFRYFKQTFIEPDGRPKYLHDRTFPVDIQCAAQAIDTLAFFSDEDAGSLDLACCVADWTMANMQSPQGYFYYRDLGWKKIKTPMFHWGQGTMFKALAHLLSKLPDAAVEAASGRYPSRARIVSPGHLRYVLITPARNEEALIENTIRSVEAQTARPLRWVIVSDGSTDRTDEIVKAHAAAHDWIDLLRMPEHRDRQFAAKAHAFNAGYERLKSLPFDLVGNLDADITVDPDYYQFLLSRFAECAELGVAGTPFVEDASQPDQHTYAHGSANLEHVSGACQMFRRECFEAVGGYVPVKGGAIDWIAVTTARMKGWTTRTFVEKICFHHRKIGTGNHSPLMARFHYGRKAYYVGGHPVWEFFRGVFEMRRRPYILRGVYFLAGYGWAWVTRMERPISPELMTFHRREQMSRLKRLLWRSRA